MLVRALLILFAIGSVTAGVSYIFGAEILAALGMIFSQLKVVTARVMAMSSGTVLAWLKAQGINFARVELGKRWLLKTLLPLLVGAAMMRRLSQLAAGFKARFVETSNQLTNWYRELPTAVRIVGILIAMCGILALAVTTMSLWLLIFSIQLPIWVAAAFAAFGQMIWQSLQKAVFRAIAFFKLTKIWAFLKKRLPETQQQGLKRFERKMARNVIRQRRAAVARLKASKLPKTVAKALHKPPGPSLPEHRSAPAVSAREGAFADAAVEATARASAGSD